MVHLLQELDRDRPSGPALDLGTLLERTLDLGRDADGHDLHQRRVDMMPIAVAVGRGHRRRVDGRSEVRARDKLAVRAQLGRRSAETDAAVLEDEGAVRHVQGRFDELLHQQHRDALLAEDTNDVEELPHHCRREALRHLVDHHQAGLGKNRAAQRDHLLLPAGQRADQLAPALAQLREELKGGCDVDVVARRVGHESQRVLDRQIWEQATAVGDVDEPELRDPLRGRAGHVPAAEHHAAATGMDHAGDRTQGGGLAGAVGADAGDHLARTHRKVDVADDLQASIPRREVLDLEQRRFLAPGRGDARDVSRRLIRLFAQVGGDDLGVAADRGGLPSRQQLAEVEDVDVVANPHHQAHVVIDQQHRDVEPLPHRVQQLRQTRRLLRVEAGRRLVQQQQPRPHRERARDLDTPLDPRRQVARQRACGTVEVEHVKDRACAFHRRAFRVRGERQMERVAERVAPAERVHRHDQVLGDGHRAPQLEVLKCARDAEARSHVRRRIDQRVAFEEDRALVRGDDAGDAVEERRLAGAVGTDQAEDLAAVQVQRHSVQSDDSAEAHCDVAYTQHRHATFTFLPPSPLTADRAWSTRWRRSPHTPSGSVMSWTINSTPTAIWNQSYEISYWRPNKVPCPYRVSTSGTKAMNAPPNAAAGTYRMPISTAMAAN